MEGFEVAAHLHASENPLLPEQAKVWPASQSSLLNAAGGV